MTVYPVERLCARSRSAPFKNGSRFTISLQDGNLLDNPPPFDGRISKDREGDGHGHRFQVEGVEGRVAEAGGSYLELIGRSCSSSIHGRIRSWNCYWSSRTKHLKLTYVSERDAVRWETPTEYGFEPMSGATAQLATTLIRLVHRQ